MASAVENCGFSKSDGVPFCSGFAFFAEHMTPEIIVETLVAGIP